VTAVQSGTQVVRHRKLITGIVVGALATTLLAVALTYWWSRSRKEKPLGVPQALPSDVHQQLSGYTFTRSDEGRRIFTVHAARTVAFKNGGTTVLEDVFVEVFGRAGNRRDVLRTRRCDYNTQSGDLFSAGKVEIELNAGAEREPGTGLRGRPVVYLETSKVSFQRQGSLAVSDELVHYRIGPASGSARGMVYATKDGWLELTKDISIELRTRGGGEEQPPAHLIARRIHYDKEDGEVRLSGPLELTQGNRRVMAGRGTIFLDDANRVTRVSLEDGVQASDASETGRLEGQAQQVRGAFDAATGQLRTAWAEGDVRLESRREGSVSRLAAQVVQVTFAGERPRAQEGNASQDVRLTIESRRAAEALSVEKKDLTASEVRFRFQPGGRSLQAAETIGVGKLVLVPSDPKAGERVITAGQFLMDFDPRNRPKTLRGLSGTRIVFQPPKDAPPGSLLRESSSDRLEAEFDPPTQTLRALQQVGAFQFREGDRLASAERADYQSQPETLVLSGRPQIWDPETRIGAERIIFDLRNGTAEGLGRVQSSHFENAGRSEAGRNDPTNVLADRVVADRRSQFVHYEGDVRAWRGQDVVESSSLDVYRAQRRVRSGSRVLTSHLQPASMVAGEKPDSATKEETRPVTIRADRLEYFDQGRKASYKGNVQLQAENTTLLADRVDVYFSAAAGGGSSRVERAVAEGHVRVTQLGRRAAGQHADYFAAEGKMLLTGGPPALYDVEKGFATGRRLTFFIHDDRLLLDGGDESRTLSRHRIAQ